MKVYAQAKVNLALDVVGTYPNGYHQLDMIMAPISIFDEIEIEKAEYDDIQCDGMDLPQNNTISKMLEVLRNENLISSYYHISVKKEIPSQAGLAGGSADAAAVFKAIIELEGLNILLDRQIELAKKVGADVPFCLVNKWSRVQGIGEIITPIQSDWKLKALLVKPSQGVSTPEAFKRWHDKEPFHPDVDLTQTAIENKNLDMLVQAMDNSLEPSAFELVPILPDIKEDMLSQEIVRVLMSGSGSSMMGFSVDDSVLEKACKNLQDKYEFVRVITIG